MSRREIKRYSEIGKVIDTIFDLEKNIFEKPYSREKLIREASFKNNLSVFVAYIDDVAVGYKAGFELSSRLYYSWIGGVSPKFRRKGIAKSLMLEQHNYIKELGYECIINCPTTVVLNDFKSLKFKDK